MWPREFVNPDSPVASCDPKQPVVTQPLQRPGGCRGVSTPVVEDSAPTEMRLQLPRMRFAKLLHGLENSFVQRSQSGCFSRLQQLPDAAWEEAVRIKDVFFDVEIRISILQLPGSISSYAMTKDQVLCASR